MQLTGDYHTHTTYSHGESSVLENVKKAASMGLKEIAITDHSYAAFRYGMKRKDYNSYKRDILEAGKECGIRTLVGVEANIIARDGSLDLRPDEIKNFEVILAWPHCVTRCKNVIEKFKLITRNVIPFILAKQKYMNMNTNKRLVKQNTQVIINALRKNKEHLDILAHPNRIFRVNLVEVARVCLETNTYFEINAVSCKFSKETLAEIAATGVQFVINSDAHSCNTVGRGQFMDSILDAIPIAQIANAGGKMVSLKNKNFVKGK